MHGKFLIVLNTCPDAETAQSIACALVDRKLAACVNIIPGVHSIYRWKGARQRDQEHILVIKTRSEHYPDLEGMLNSMHPYEVPEIIAVPVETGLASYLAWMDEST